MYLLIFLKYIFVDYVFILYKFVIEDYEIFILLTRVIM